MNTKSSVTPDGISGIPCDCRCERLVKDQKTSLTKCAKYINEEQKSKIAEPLVHILSI